MYVKRSGKYIFGADFTAAEKKAINLEINRQLADLTRGHAQELDAIILWYLHEEFGFGKKRLRRCFSGFSDAIEALAKRYEATDNAEKAWICSKKLKKIGVNLDEWEREIE